MVKFVGRSVESVPDCTAVPLTFRAQLRPLCWVLVFLALILTVLVPLCGEEALLSATSMVVSVCCGDTIKGLSFAAVSFILENNGEVVHDPRARSEDGLRNWAIWDF